MMKLAIVADNRDAKSSHRFISYIINSKQFIQRSSGPWNKLQNIHHTLWWWDYSWFKSGPRFVYHIGKRLRWWPNTGTESRVLLNRAAEAGDAIPLSPYSLLPPIPTKVDYVQQYALLHSMHQIAMSYSCTTMCYSSVHWNSKLLYFYPMFSMSQSEK